MLKLTDTVRASCQCNLHIDHQPAVEVKMGILHGKTYKAVVRKMFLRWIMMLVEEQTYINKPCKVESKRFLTTQWVRNGLKYSSGGKKSNCFQERNFMEGFRWCDCRDIYQRVLFSTLHITATFFIVFLISIVELKDKKDGKCA